MIPSFLARALTYVLPRIPKVRLRAMHSPARVYACLASNQTGFERYALPLCTTEATDENGSLRGFNKMQESNSGTHVKSPTQVDSPLDTSMDTSQGPSRSASTFSVASSGTMIRQKVEKDDVADYVEVSAHH